MRKAGIAIAAAVLALGAGEAVAVRSPAQAAVDAWIQDELRPFSGQGELRDYMRDVRRAARERGLWWARRHDDRDGETITLTGSRIVRRNASITNVQEEGVDEGDVVKQIGRFLVVLQDGRLFSIDTGRATGELALADRVNVYRAVPRDEFEEDWYDEVLVRGDRVLVTGYSYERDVSEISVFRLTAAGRFVREGIFQIDSDDYYDGHNYSTRLIGDNLVIYTPYDLARPNEERVRFPRVSRVEAGPGGADRPGPWRPLLDVRSLYGPLTNTLEPVIHSISVCPLARTSAGALLSCRTRAFIGPHARNLYVTLEHIYLWVGAPDDESIGRDERDCPSEHRATFAEAEPSTVYRMSVGAGEPVALRVRGEPFDQFSFDESGGALRALVQWRAAGCARRYSDPVHLSYLSLPLGLFERHVREAPASAFHALPPTSSTDVANRFTATHLAYAPLDEYDYHEDQEVRRDRIEPLASHLVVVPLARPSEARSIPLSHNVRRLEVVGDDLFVSGYTAGRLEGSSLSYVETSGVPRLASSLRLDHRFDGEGRSHAFNLLLNADGSAVLGLPTIPDAEERSDDASWSIPSDLSFFWLDSGGRMRAIGLLSSSLPRRLQVDRVDEDLADGEPDPDAIPGYSCEVSCVDWYGNSRPIFSGGRIFALSATELIEGRLEGGRVVEVGRLDFARARTR